MWWQRKSKLTHLPAIWILASKDQRRIISYAGLYYRLVHKESFKGKTRLAGIREMKGVKELSEVVSINRELFKPGGVLKQELSDWRDKLEIFRKANSSNYPEWLKEIDNETV